MCDVGDSGISQFLVSLSTGVSYRYSPSSTGRSILSGHWVISGFDAAARMSLAWKKLGSKPNGGFHAWSTGAVFV
jgi:hypothetical protein